MSKIDEIKINEEKKLPNKWLVITVIAMWTILLPLLYPPSLFLIIGIYTFTIFYKISSKFKILEKIKNFSLSKKTKNTLGIITGIIILIILFMTWRIILNAIIWGLTWLGIIVAAPFLLYVIGIACIASLVLSIFT